MHLMSIITMLSNHNLQQKTLYYRTTSRKKDKTHLQLNLFFKPKTTNLTGNKCRKLQKHGEIISISLLTKMHIYCPLKASDRDNQRLNLNNNS